MKELRTTIRHIRNSILKSYAIVGLLIGLLIVTGVAVKAEFYPDRQPFDYNKPCNPNDSDIYDRCGSLTGPVFNSFINTPSYGDERAFFDARRSDQTAAGSFKNVLSNVTEGSQEVVLRTYVHNNANVSTNATNGVAKNTKVRIALPTATGQALRARSYISADNATPKLIEDTVDLTASEEFSIQYIPGSAMLYNNGPFKNGVKLSDSIINGGALIGHDNLNGNMPGCFEYEAVVQIRVKIVPKKKPGVKFEKQVAVPGQTNWGEKVSVKPGDSVRWLITFQNQGSAQLNNVNISDKLPPHVQVKPGSVRWIYTGTDGSTQDVGQNDTQLFTTGGIDFGGWAPNGGFYVRFETVAKDDFEGCQVTIRNIAYNKTKETERTEDFADVEIKKPNCKPAQPVTSCDALVRTAVSGQDRTFTFSTRATAEGGAKIKQYRYDFGDGSPVLTTNQATTPAHTFPNGDFVTTVTVDFEVDGRTVSKTSDACRVALASQPTSPPPAQQLPVTGAGGVASIFAISSIAGAVAHRWFVSRRFSR